LNRKQNKWIQFLIDFHFVIIYLLEKSNEKVDLLIKKAKNVSNKKNDRQKQQNQILLSFEQFDQSNFLQTIELIVVLESNRLSLMQEMHDQLAINHSKVNKTIRLLRRNHHWSEMIRDVKQYVRNCHICRRIKATRNKYHELLNSLLILDRSWIDIILDFVTKLLNSKNYNAILMIIDRLNKIHHYILCTIDEKKTTIEKTIKLFIQHVWKLHKLFITMIFDKESQFLSLVWDKICKMLKIKAKLFTAFHSKTDKQSEIFNQKMKRYLRAYVNHQQDDWADWLFMTKYAFNAFISAITQIFSFFANYEFESRMSFDHFEFEENTIKDRINRIRERGIVFTMKNIWKFAKKHMKKNQQNQIIYVNKHRTSISDYEVENQVWLFIKNIQIDWSFRKLDRKMIKSFKILEKRDNSYKFDFSNEMNIHSIFHISLLRKNSQDFISNEIIFSSSSIIIDDEKEYDVKNIIDSRLIKRVLNKRLQYKIRWVEHSSNRKWYSIENFDNAKEIVIDYHQRYFDKSKSNFLSIQFLIISRMSHLNNSRSWVQQNIHETKIIVQDILNKMKKEMTSIVKLSIFSVDWNFINIESIRQTVRRIVLRQSKRRRALFRRRKFDCINRVYLVKSSIYEKCSAFINEISFSYFFVWDQYLIILW
jgi:hypothetical protein